MAKRLLRLVALADPERGGPDVNFGIDTPKMMTS